ncbi:MAG TPA: hypothetical protein VJS44_18555 [Pyrinomonadaceae bacterium]|nr:hypothetical protein [Pyrinomonadaceae bacterium]
MKRSFLLALFLMLFFYGSAAAQQGFLVAQDDRDDPCSRFKMRVLVPTGLDTFKPSPERPADGVDYKIRMWNPCRRNEPQLALMTPTRTIPDARASIFSPKSYGVRFPFLENGQQKKSTGFFQFKPSQSWKLEQRQK